MKVLLPAALLVILSITGLWWWHNHARTTPPATEVATTTTSTSPQTNDSFSWEFVAAGTQPETDIPLTQVFLTSSRTSARYDTGTYSGSCSPLSPTDLLPGEVAGVLCWFGGGGNEIGVFSETGRYVIKKGVQEEGTSEDAGFRGDFKTIITL